jgi:hypothetical protein
MGARPKGAIPFVSMRKCHFGRTFGLAKTEVSAPASQVCEQWKTLCRLVHGFNPPARETQPTPLTAKRGSNQLHACWVIQVCLAEPRSAPESDCAAHEE